MWFTLTKKPPRDFILNWRSNDYYHWFKRLYIIFRVLFVSDDDTRVSLTHLPGVPGSDYINANYINVSITLFWRPLLLLERMLFTVAKYPCLKSPLDTYDDQSFGMSLKHTLLIKYVIKWITIQFESFNFCLYRLVCKKKIQI